MDFASMRKAFVGPVVMLVLIVLGAFHITGAMSVQDLVTYIVTGLLTGFGVYQIPNKQ